MRTKRPDIKNVSRVVASHCLLHPPRNRFASSARVVGFLAFTLGGLVHAPLARAQEEVGVKASSEDAPVAANVESVSEAAPDGADTATVTEVNAANDSLWSRARFALPIEASVIGLTVGVRPEFLFQPFESARWFELRAAAGVLPGLE